MVSTCSGVADFLFFFPAQKRGHFKLMTSLVELSLKVI